MAPSAAGLALGAAALIAFVARRPLRVVMVDRWRGRDLERTRLAARVAAVELTALAALAAGLWLVMAARSAAAPPFIRVQLLRFRALPHRLWPSDGA